MTVIVEKTSASWAKKKKSLWWNYSLLIFSDDNVLSVCSAFIYNYIWLGVSLLKICHFSVNNKNHPVLLVPHVSFVVVIYLLQHLNPSSFRGALHFYFSDCTVALQESPLLLRGAVCLIQNPLCLATNAGLGFVFISSWIFRLCSRLDFFLGTCCFTIQLNQLQLWPSSTQMHWCSIWCLYRRFWLLLMML